MTPERWKEVESLLHEVLNRDLVERESFLHGACGKDAVLLADVMSLLQAHDEGQHFLETHALDAAAKDLASECVLAPFSTTRLGDFELREEIGRGGMGVVYVAEQVSLRRTVALKILPRHAVLDPRLLARFRIEAQAAAKLQHPHIVPVYGFGSEGNVHYFAMQRIHGQGLDKVIHELQRLRSTAREIPDWGAGGQDPASSTSLAMGLISGTYIGAASPIERHRWPIVRFLLPLASGKIYYQSTARIIREIAEALAYAHAHGVLHRDLKPSNCILDACGKAWLADFGLAKDLAQGSLTQSGELIPGTLRYLAPERFEDKADARSDLYSLGLTLYELLALRPAFEASERSKLLKQVLSGRAPPLRRLDPSIPKVLAAIAERAIAREPAERYPKASDLALDLQRYERGLAPLIARTDASYRTGRFILRHKLGAAAALLLAFAGLVCLGWMWVESQRARGPSFLVAADFDGDGRLDLAVANTESPHVSLLLNPGHSDGKTQTFHLEQGFQSLCAGDLDGDRLVDLALPGLTAQHVQVIFNQRGGFDGRPLQVPLEGNVFSVCILDSDGDGRLDLAAAGGENNVWILRNQGRRSFARERDLEVAKYPDIIDAADFDNDGLGDLITAHMGAHKLCVLMGKGYFSSSQEIELEGGPAHVIAADLDGDGRKDLASALLDEHQIAINLNLTSGGFGESALYPTEGSVQCLDANDIDGDGDLDLAGVGGERHVVIFSNEGRGILSKPQVLPGGDGPSALVIEDLDGDGNVDLLISNFRGNDLSFLQGRGKLRFEERARLPISRW